MLGKKALLLFIVLVVLCISVAGCVSKSKYDTLVQDYETSQTNLTSAQREYDLLQSEMTTLQKEWETAKAALEAEIASKSATISKAQQDIAELQQDIADLQVKLDAALNTEIKQAFAFSFQSKTFTWELSIPLKTFLYYKDQPRITDTSKYTKMVTDNYADSLLNKLILQIKDAVLRYNFNKSDQIDLVGAFVHSLIFANNDVTTPYDNYPRYPIETLFDQTADSEDTSILTAALLYRLDYSLVFFVFTEPKHAALGIYIPAAMGSDGWEYQAKRYIYLETTGDTWTLGHAPSEYVMLQPQIYPVGQ
jgi:hypothetical protein